MRRSWSSYPFCLVLAIHGISMAAGGELTTSADLIRMHRGGLRDATILDFLRIYHASLAVSDSDWLELSQAGIDPNMVKALRDYAEANPGPPSNEALVPEPDSAAIDPIPRFFVGYPHDPAAFPSWYYKPFSGEVSSASQYPGRGAPRASYWRRGATYVWFHSRRP